DPERLGGREHRVALALPAKLDRVARDLRVLTRVWWVEGTERRPIPALAERLQRIDAQPVAEWRIRPLDDERLHVVDRDSVDPEREPPVVDIRLQRMSRQFGGKCVEARP